MGEKEANAGIEATLGASGGRMESQGNLHGHQSYGEKRADHRARVAARKAERQKMIDEAARVVMAKHYRMAE
jgi:hypothetical protein